MRLSDDAPAPVDDASRALVAEHEAQHWLASEPDIEDYDDVKSLATLLRTWEARGRDRGLEESARECEDADGDSVSMTKMASRIRALRDTGKSGG